MPEPIRVRDDKTLAEYSTYGTAEPGLTKLDEPAVDAHGELIPPKYPDAQPTAAPAVPEAPAAPAAQSTTGPRATTKES